MFKCEWANGVMDFDNKDDDLSITLKNKQYHRFSINALWSTYQQFPVWWHSFLSEPNFLPQEVCQDVSHRPSPDIHKPSSQEPPVPFPLFQDSRQDLLSAMYMERARMNAKILLMVDN